jgi:transposase IS166 family protein
MLLDLNNLPTDTDLLHRLVPDLVSKIEHRDGEIERLKSIVKQLQRAQFGRRSERLDPDQLALGLEDIEGDLAREEESRRPAEATNRTIFPSQIAARPFGARGCAARHRWPDLHLLRWQAACDRRER